MTLPLLLAGPVLRRVSPTEIWVWLAFSEELAPRLEVQLEIYDGEPSHYDLIYGDHINGAIGSSLSRKQSNVISLGVLGNLFAYWVRAVPIGGASYPVNKFLFYEVFVVDSASTRYGLSEHLLSEARTSWNNSRITGPVFTLGYAGSLSERESVGPANSILAFDLSWRGSPAIISAEPASPGRGGRNAVQSVLPRFVISDKGCLNVWAGSCIKLHGYGESATRAMYSPTSRETGILTTRLGLPARWPSAMCFIGDQIYADDVSFTLLEGVRALARALEPTGPEDIEGTSYKLSSITSLERGLLTTEGNKFTPFSVDQGVYNHLLSLPEYCAYYLMHLNAAMWPQLDLAVDSSLSSYEALNFSLSERRARQEVEKRRLEASRREIRDLSTVIANVPTYCLLDDHEVTDDFMFDSKFRSALVPRDTLSEHRPCETGSYIVANALFAYAVFQGIGNDPPQMIDDVRAAWGKEKSLGRTQALLSIDWSFATPTVPKLLFLDTRTKRSTKNSKGEFPAAKIKDMTVVFGDSGFGGSQPSYPIDFDVWLYDDERFAELVSSCTTEDKQLFIFTPLPVLASESVERSRKRLTAFRLSPFSDQQSRRFDLEGWKANPSNLYSFVKALMDNGVRRCYAVGGDVHYGFQRTATFGFREDILKPTADADMLTVEQTVVSPILNTFEYKFGDGGSSFSALLRNRVVDSVFADISNNILSRYDEGSKTWLFERLDHVAAKGPSAGFVETSLPVTEVRVDNHFVEISISKSKVSVAVFPAQSSSLMVSRAREQGGAMRRLR